VDEKFSLILLFLLVKMNSEPMSDIEAIPQITMATHLSPPQSHFNLGPNTGAS
jgi:hypothetical protein